MEYFKTYEIFKTHLYYDFHEIKKEDSSKFYFQSENNWEYEVGFNKTNNNMFFFGFKAKNEDMYFFDFNVVTNDNIFKIISTIKYILEYHYNKYQPENGYIFSVQAGDKESTNKRIKLYLKMLESMTEWNIEKDPDMNRWYLKRT